MRISVIIVLLGLTVSLNAQNFQRELGCRGGLSGGVTYKVYMNNQDAVEGILGFRNGGIQLTGLREFHTSPVFGLSDKFSFFYGYGGHVGSISTYKKIEFYHDEDIYVKYKHRHSPVIGADGIVGIDYSFAKIPFRVGLDYKPFMEFFGERFFKVHFGDFAFSVRYIFNHKN